MRAVNEAVAESVAAGEKGIFEFEPDADQLVIEMIAVSKFPGLTYEVRVDGDRRYGPAPAPPTDVDDAVTTHDPAVDVRRKMKVIARNPSSTDRFIISQIRGKES